MRLSLFGAGRKARPSPNGTVYAVGDVHGCAELLLRLVDAIMQDIANSADRHRPEIVFLGDYIDRGADSRSVIEFLMTLAEWPEIEPVFLLGNHELMLLDFLSDPIRNWQWLRHGAVDTLASYGIGPLGEIGSRDQMVALAATARDALGAHLQFVQGLTAWHMNGNLLFSHAGADPRLPPEQQQRESLVWGAPAFYRGNRRDGLWVVHGHRHVDRPEIRQCRIAIDTGAYCTGRLAAMKASSQGIGFLTAGGSSG